MCGVCGIVNFDRRDFVDRQVLQAMNRQIVHRGPDEEGLYVAENVGLAMQRLSIIDLRTGQQPVTNEDRTVWLVYNGEIYNHQKLRADLQKRGHRYRSQSDTETIVHLYEEYGRECVRHLRGMFAFAIWDSRQRRFFAARDRLGIKPFYYLQSTQRFLFGSEIKALLAFPGVKAEMKRAALPEYLAFGYLSGPESFFEGIQKLLPGHTLELDEQGALGIERYWDLPFHEDVDSRPKSFYVNTYRELLEHAVQSHLMSDVPLGVFLSGGIDSSTVAALMTRIRREPIETFSVGYENSTYSELEHARLMAGHIGSVHHEVIMSERDFFDAMPKLVWHEDEPITWTSSVALYFCARLAREHVTVVLTGEGSDETLAGYARYPITLWNARAGRIYSGLVPSPIRRKITESIIEQYGSRSSFKRKLAHTFLGRSGDPWNSFYFDNFYSAFSESDQLQLLSDEMAEELRSSPGLVYRNNLAHWERSKGDLVQRTLYTDIKTYLVELLMKQDNMSMAASIESRVPFLDHVLVEFATGIPARYQIRGITGKAVLKSAVKDLLPPAIIHRRKAGFPTPWQSWLTGTRLKTIEDFLLDPRALGRGFFKAEALRRIFAQQREGVIDKADCLWRLLNLEIWNRVLVDGDRPQMS